MHILLIALIGISTGSPALLDQTNEEWTAPGYRVIEEVSIDPLDYGEAVSWGENCNGPTASIGCKGFFVPTEDGEKWRIIMLLKDKLVVLQEDENVREIPLTFSPRGIVYSRNGKFVLVLGDILGTRTRYDGREAEIVNISTGNTRIFEPLLNSEWPGMIFLNDDGSVYLWENQYFQRVEYFDSNFNLLCSRGIETVYWSAHFYHASNGSIILFSSPDIVVFNKHGTLLWEYEWEDEQGGYFNCYPVVIADGSFVLISSALGLMCYDGFSGELLWEDTETVTRVAVSSVSGYSWAASLRNGGMAVSTDAGRAEAIVEVLYPVSAWSHGIPHAVAPNGSVISGSYSSAPYPNAHLAKIIYTNVEGSIIWVSSPSSTASSPLTFSRNNNSENELRRVSSIQSDGERFIYTDYETVKVMRVEEIEELLND